MVFSLSFQTSVLHATNTQLLSYFQSKFLHLRTVGWCYSVYRDFCQVVIRYFIQCSEVWGGRTWQCPSSISYKTLTICCILAERRRRQKQQDEERGPGVSHCDHWGKACYLLLYGQHCSNVTVTTLTWTRHYQTSDNRLKLKQFLKCIV
jgi:hypothetical protein